MILFRSVTWKMLEFFASYICLALGFMMTFMILFSSCSSFKLKNFPGGLVTVIVMMLGELEFKDTYFPSSLRFDPKTREIQEQDEFLQFPGKLRLFSSQNQNVTLGTAIFFVILFILVFGLVIMNLLVGLSVSDINSLMKTGKRDQLRNAFK